MTLTFVAMLVVGGLEALLVAVLLYRWVTTTPARADFDTPHGGTGAWQRLLSGTQLELAPLLGQLQQRGVPARIVRMEWMMPHAAGIMGVSETSAASALEVPASHLSQAERVVEGLPPLPRPRRVPPADSDAAVSAEGPAVEVAFDPVPLVVLIGLGALLLYFMSQLR